MGSLLEASSWFSWILSSLFRLFLCSQTDINVMLRSGLWVGPSAAGLFMSLTLCSGSLSCCRIDASLLVLAMDQNLYFNICEILNLKLQSCSCEPAQSLHDVSLLPAHT